MGMEPLHTQQLARWTACLASLLSRGCACTEDIEFKSTSIYCYAEMSSTACPASLPSGGRACIEEMGLSTSINRYVGMDCNSDGYRGGQPAATSGGVMRRGIWELKLAMRMAAGRRRGGGISSASEAGGKLAFADQRRASGELRRRGSGRELTWTED